jgi:hypothetical protein
MVDPKLTLAFYVEHAVMFDVFRDHYLYGLSSYAIVADIPHAQKGGVTIEEAPARYTSFRTLFKSFREKENVTC